MINWNAIDTVLLDMDGTLLDLHFDNYFWLTHLPDRYAAIHQLDAEVAKNHLHEQIRALEGTLNWYCLDYWSDALQVDIPALKAEISEKIQIRPHVELFLDRLRGAGKECVLITNAHPDSLSLKLKVTGIGARLDKVISSHELKYPKEAQPFWQALQQRLHFDPARTLFIDDTVRILASAQTFGIAHLLCIHQPDSKQPRTIEGFPAIDHFDEIMPDIYQRPD